MAVEEVVVSVDELQVEGDQEGELRQVDGVGVEGEVSEVPSGVQELSTGFLAEDEPDECRVGLGELWEGEFAFATEVALVEEGGDEEVLVVFRTDDVFEVLFVDDTGLVFADEAIDITAIAASSS